MQSLEAFEAYYAATMRPRLEALETVRRTAQPRFWRYLRWWLAAWAMLIVGALAMGRSVEQLYEELLPWHALFFAGVFLIPLWRLIRFSLRIKPVRQACKDEVIVPMVRWLAPELTYDPQGSVDLALVAPSGLVRDHDRLEGEDYFRGRVGETELEFCELGVHYHTTERRRDGSTRTVHHEERGLLLLATANKAFSGETRIYPDDLEAVLGDTAARMLTQRRRGDLHLIHMEDPQFERLFKVYCTDDVEAHYILTPSLMARLAAYRETHGRDVRLSFQQSRLFAYFPPMIGKRYALFDVFGDRDLLDVETFRPMYEELATALGIVEELNLNTRIWSAAGD